MPESYWTCPRLWPGETVFIVAGGPSVATADMQRLAGRRVIAVNSSVFTWPAADFLYFGDARWWQVNMRALGGFAGTIVSTARTVISPRVMKMKKIRLPPGLAVDQRCLVMQRTSLTGALNLAFHLGAARVALIGADMQPAGDGRTHHHAPHPWPQRPGCWDEQMADLKLMIGPLAKHGLEVVNCSPASRIDWWRRASLEDLTGELEKEAA